MHSNIETSNLSKLINIEKENISKIFKMWWDGKELNNIYKASYYHSKMLLIRYKSEKFKALQHNAGEEYSKYLQKCSVKKGELFIDHPEIK